MQRYLVIHDTEYRYAGAVALSQQLMHLTPRPLPWQECVSHRIDIDPEPAETSTRTDYFGNPVLHAVITRPHRSLKVHAESSVAVLPRYNIMRAAGSPPWEAVRERLSTLGDTPLVEPCRYLFESLHVRFDPTLLEYARPSFPARARLFDCVLDLNHRIHEDFEFDPAATSVSTPLAEILEQRRGVCQDFAHLMTGCLRSVGLAARYVSGYILTTPPPGKPRLIGADASHAWISVYCPASGWIDFDPTNDKVVDTEHVTLAWGRDFADVTPMRGVILGEGGQELEVKVTVVPEAEARATLRR